MADNGQTHGDLFSTTSSSKFLFWLCYKAEKSSDKSTRRLHCVCQQYIFVCLRKNCSHSILQMLVTGASINHSFRSNTVQITVQWPVLFFIHFFFTQVQTPVTLSSGELWSILVVRLAHSADLKSRLRHVSGAPSVAYSTGCYWNRYKRGQQHSGYSLLFDWCGTIDKRAACFYFCWTREKKQYCTESLFNCASLYRRKRATCIWVEAGNHRGTQVTWTHSWTITASGSVKAIKERKPLPWMNSCQWSSSVFTPTKTLGTERVCNCMQAQWVHESRSMTFL